MGREYAPMEELRKHATLVVLVRQALAASSVGFAASLLLVEGVESGQEAGALLTRQYLYREEYH